MANIAFHLSAFRLGDQMLVTDFDGDAEVRTKKQLERRLTSIHKGKDGPFILSHTKGGPSLWIHLHESIAYLHYFPEPDFLNHAGYQATGMTPPECDESVRFLVIGGDAIVMPRSSLVSLSDAIVAAKEFFGDPALPASIQWLEL